MVTNYDRLFPRRPDFPIKIVHRRDIHYRMWTLCGLETSKVPTMAQDFTAGTCEECEGVQAILEYGPTEHLTPAEARAIWNERHLD